MFEISSVLQCCNNELKLVLPSYQLEPNCPTLVYHLHFVAKALSRFATTEIHCCSPERTADGDCAALSKRRLKAICREQGKTSYTVSKLLSAWSDLSGRKEKAVFFPPD